MQTHTYTSARLLFFSPRRYLSRYVQTFFSFLFLLHYFGGNGIREFVPHPLYPIPRAPSYRDCSRPSRCCYMPKSIPCIYPSTYLHTYADGRCRMHPSSSRHRPSISACYIAAPSLDKLGGARNGARPSPFCFSFFPSLPAESREGGGDREISSAHILVFARDHRHHRTCTHTGGGRETG